MRRFYNGRAEDFSLEELESFLLCLPAESSTYKATSDLEMPAEYNEFLLAAVVDSIRAIGKGLSRRRLSKSQQLTPYFSGEKKREQLKLEKVAKTIKEREQNGRRNEDRGWKFERGDSATGGKEERVVLGGRTYRRKTKV